jgi:hypothetical protein
MLGWRSTGLSIASRNSDAAHVCSSVFRSSNSRRTFTPRSAAAMTRAISNWPDLVAEPDVVLQVQRVPRRVDDDQPPGQRVQVALERHEARGLVATLAAHMVLGGRKGAALSWCLGETGRELGQWRGGGAAGQCHRDNQKARTGPFARNLQPFSKKHAESLDFESRELSNKHRMPAPLRGSARSGCSLSPWEGQCPEWFWPENASPCGVEI